MQTQHTFFNQIQKTAQVGVCIFDVPLHSDCSLKVREPQNTDVISKSFSEKNITSVFAQYLFPCQTRATARSEFDEEKSSVLGESIPARHVGGWVCSHVAHWKCVRGTQRVPINAYQRSGYIVTPLERCMLQHVSL